MKQFITCVFLALSCYGIAQPAARKAMIGTRISAGDNGIRIDSVLPNSTAALLKLKKNDLITAFNGTDVKSISE